MIYSLSGCFFGRLKAPLLVLVQPLTRSHMHAGVEEALPAAAVTLAPAAAVAVAVSATTATTTVRPDSHLIMPDQDHPVQQRRRRREENEEKTWKTKIAILQRIIA